jgi:ATP-dependent 26S proteasome regulatory subunit
LNDYAVLNLIIEWVHFHLLNLLATEEEKEELVEDFELAELQQKISHLDTLDPLPNLIKLGHIFELSPFERQILWLCLAVELSPDLNLLCGQIQQNDDFNYPTFALALTIFNQPDTVALSPSAPLRYWHFIHIKRLPQRPFLNCPLEIDERIFHYVQGIDMHDIRLGGYVMAFSKNITEFSLPDSQLVHIKPAQDYIQQAQIQQESPYIQLVGVDEISKQAVAQQIASAEEIQVYHLQLEQMPQQAIDFVHWIRLWNREQRLSKCSLYITTEAVVETEGGTHYKRMDRLAYFLHHHEGLCFLSARTPLKGMAEPSLILDIEKPTIPEQIGTWQKRLGTTTPQIPIKLATQFNFNLSTIHTVSEVGLADLNENTPLNQTALWQRALIHSRAEIDELAERIVPKMTWDDIVLSEQERRLLNLIAEQVSRQGEIYEQWGFRKKLSRGLGMTVLFAGESGTGKTMAAEILAHHLNLNLYRIDLSSVVSKYIGETEKNLRKIFDAADEGGMILFFDEADALFGKRSEVKNSNDRYANIEVNYLLQRIEAFQGLAILATNFKSGLDEAFMRRIRFVVTFSKPNTPQRMLIWQKSFPPETPVGDLDYEYLANEFKFTGGEVRNIALNAAFIAHIAQSAVEMQHILDAIYIEMIKQNRIVNEAEFRWQKIDEA